MLYFLCLNPCGALGSNLKGGTYVPLWFAAKDRKPKPPSRRVVLYSGPPGTPGRGKPRWGARGAFTSILIIASAFFFVPPGPACAAQKTIGVIMTADTPYYNSIHQALVNELHVRGIGADKGAIAVQRPAPTKMAWLNAARKLCAWEASVIVTYGTPATLSVMGETSTIPIVFVGISDPAEIGISAENVTGVTSRLPITALIKYLKLMAGFSRLGIVYCSLEADAVKQVETVRKLEAQFGFSSTEFDLDHTRAEITLPKVDALFITTSSVLATCIDKIVKCSLDAHIPAVAALGGVEDKGVVLAASQDPGMLGKEAATIVAQIVQGGKPSSIPFTSATQVELTINVGIAGRLGLKVPLELLTTATRVIK